jgi:hypothetical protein
VARHYLRHVVQDRSGNVVQNAAVSVFQPGTTTAALGTMFDAPSGGNVITNPLISNARGMVQAWLSVGQEVDLRKTDNGGTAFYPSAPGTPFTFPNVTDTGRTSMLPPVAADVPYTPVAGSSVNSTDVQGAINQLVALVGSGGGGGGGPSDLSGHLTLGLAPEVDITNHTGATSGAHTAASISFAPTGTISHTDVQAAIAEVASEAGASAHPDTTYHSVNMGLATDQEVTDAFTAHNNASGNPHTQYQLSSQKGVASGYASLNASTLVPIGQLGSGTADNTTFLRGDRTWAVPPSADLSAYATDAELAAHTGDTTDAHPASAVTFTPAAGISDTDVQHAIQTAASMGGGSGSTAITWAPPNYFVYKGTGATAGTKYRVIRLSDSTELTLYTDANDVATPINGAFADGQDGTTVAIRGGARGTLTGPNPTDYLARTPIQTTHDKQYLIGPSLMGHQPDSTTETTQQGAQITADATFPNNKALFTIGGLNGSTPFGSGSGVFGVNFNAGNIAQQACIVSQYSGGVTVSHSWMQGGTLNTLRVQGRNATYLTGWRHNLIQLRLDGQDHPTEATLYTDSPDGVMVNVHIHKPANNAVVWSHHGNGWEVSNVHPTGHAGIKDNTVFDGAIYNCVSNMYIDTTGGTTTGTLSTLLRLKGSSDGNLLTNIFLTQVNANGLPAIALESTVRALQMTDVFINSAGGRDLKYAVQFMQSSGADVTSLTQFVGTKLSIRSTDVLNTSNVQGLLTESSDVEIDHHNYLAGASTAPAYKTSRFIMHQQGQPMQHVATAARSSLSVNQTFAQSAAQGPINFDVNDIVQPGGGTLHATGVPSRFKVPAGGAGVWRLVAMIATDQDATNNLRFTLALRVNGSTIKKILNFSGSNTRETSADIEDLFLLADNDYVEVLYDPAGAAEARDIVGGTTKSSAEWFRLGGS